jgi:hypothetical protein
MVIIMILIIKKCLSSLWPIKFAFIIIVILFSAAIWIGGDNITSFSEGQQQSSQMLEPSLGVRITSPATGQSVPIGDGVLKILGTSTINNNNASVNVTGVAMQLSSSAAAVAANNNNNNLSNNQTTTATTTATTTTTSLQSIDKSNNNNNTGKEGKPLSISIQSSSQNIVNGKGKATITAVAHDVTSGKKIDNAIVKLKVTFPYNATAKEISGYNGQAIYSIDIKPDSNNNNNNRNNSFIIVTAQASAPGYIYTGNAMTTMAFNNNGNSISVMNNNNDEFHGNGNNND